jgi:hypothetical protein
MKDSLAVGLRVVLVQTSRRTNRATVVVEVRIRGEIVALALPLL